MGYYNDDELTGQEIYDRYHRGDRTFRTMGRDGGFEGDIRMFLPRDLATGGWRDRVYQVRYSSIPHNGNWFTIDRFINHIDDHGATNSN